ncbi:hypothetical protein HDF24_24360 [Mucilaginibacter sp. X4EP1]|uniref:hypothetical protein n=1 Tax=Mucilaginibacter sp. X4EP1 TaxID=2723092 RepID=UPI002167A715|nr:hypothetical protein [Mucilaginibacter sp. X4EP1]MCS3815262.1 hypothetical protein [Mucilaginibacter sp. X4EP1]
MKTNSLYLLLFLAVSIASCSKAKIIPKPTLTGTWNVVRDSFAYNYPPIITNYIGVTGDYVNFKSNGIADVIEGQKMDSLAYKVTSDSTVIFYNSYGIGSIYLMKPFTDHNVTLKYSGYSAQPPSYESQMLILSR